MCNKTEKSINTTIKVSFICVYNDLEMMQNLQKEISLFSDEKYVFEFITIDNQEKAYSSAADALNYGASISDGNYFVFIHQDMIINDFNYILKMVEFLKESPKSIVGIAGVCEEHKGSVSNMSDPHRPQGYNSLIASPTAVQTCDECFIMICRDTFYNLGCFDGKTFDGFHLYVCDLCLTAIENNCGVYVMDSNMHHLSGGNIDNSFRLSFEKLRRKHKKCFKAIRTTCSFAYSNDVKYFCYSCIRKAKRLLLRK